MSRAPRSLRNARLCCAALVLLLLAAAPGCRTSPSAPEDEAMAGTPLPAGDPLAARLIGELEESAQVRDSMRGAARLSLDAPDLRFRRPQRFAAQRPGAIRVEILGLFQQVAAVLVTRDGRYQFFDSGERRLQHGPVTPDLLWQVARVDLSPEQVVELLLGAPTPSPGLEPRGGQRFPDGSVRVDLADESKRLRQRFGFDAASRLRRVEHFDVDGVPMWEVRFGEYRDTDLGPTPFEIVLDFPHQATSATLSFRDLELNPDLPPDVFVLHVPDGGSSKKPGRSGPGRG